MKVLTKKEAVSIGVALLHMQDVIDRNALTRQVYDELSSCIRDIARAAGKDTEFRYALGVTDRIYGK